MIKDRKPLAETHPHLLKEWDWEKNRGLSPDELHAGSHKKAHWVCKEGHRYFALISNRGVHGSGCPFCAGNRALSGFNDLATVKPKIADQWDHEKNPFPPHSVTSASGKRAWWRCEIGHSWEAVIASRKTSGCPVCAGRAVEIGYNDLQSQRPELASEWDFERNAKGPENFTAGSSLKAHWVCGNGHSFTATIASRSNGTGCPICAGRRVLPGFNDFGSNFPELAAEWDLVRNAKKPTEIPIGAKGKFFWKCSSGHSYSATTNDRRDGTGCPYCSGRLPIEGETDLVTTHPDLALEWDFSANAPHRPEDVKAGTNRSVAWVCGQGHQYSTSVAHRALGGTGCPYCANQKLLKGFNDLATKFPALASEWCQAKNGDLTPSDVIYRTNKKMAWSCPLGHTYVASPSKRILEGTGCSVCAGKSVQKGSNDLLTLYPQIAAEWDSSQNALGPDQITVGSNRKFFWLCESGHSWKAAVEKRVTNRGCPQCAEYGFKPDDASAVYLLRNTQLRARKVGITNRTRGNNRVGTFLSAGWELVKEWEMNGAEARTIESEIFKWIRTELVLPQFLTRQEMGRAGGETETFSTEGPSDADVARKIQAIVDARKRRG